MDDQVTRPGRHGTGGRVLLEGVLVAVLWLLFAGSLHWHDLVVAGLLAVAAGVGGAALRRRLGHRPATVATWLPLLPAIVVGLLRDSWIVTCRFVDLVRGRRVAGEIVEVPFVVGPASAGADEEGTDVPAGAGDAETAATTRRVVATIATTLQPNSILLGFDHERDVAIVHRLSDTDTPPIHPRLTEPR
ncbi:hypothetical protein [Egicoccus sp. AB-alg2]|uniref:hypothetical protein n=1 Tax=Egicoccus sp. AB-alg2 TaxID=3242693 RepID=UPI00359DF7E0